MRPRGEVREALLAAAVDLYGASGACTWVQMAQRAQVGYEVARTTAKNMATAGELVRVGKDKPEGSSVWLTMYEPAHQAGQAPADGAAALEDAVRRWVDFL
jgi:hypothetical protein